MSQPIPMRDAILSLLDQVAEVETKLAPNELEIFEQLKAKYAGPCDIGFEDKALLEVALRNVKIRDQENVKA